MRKSAVLLVAVLGLFIVLGVMLLQSLVIIQRIASVSDVSGPVYVMTRTASQFSPLGDRERVVAGTVVKTGPGGTVTLNWVDGSRVRLGPETVVRVRKCTLNTTTRATTSLFDLHVGRIWVRVLSALEGRTKFEVRTPTATAGVRGTVFSVAVDPRGVTEVEVYEGTVHVAGRAGEASVGAGQEARAAADGPPAVIPQKAPTESDELVGILGPRLDLDQAPEIVLPPGTGTVTVSGISEPGATVTINGSPVTLDRQNRFVAEVPLTGMGGDMIVVSAADGRGNTTVRAIGVRVAGD